MSIMLSILVLISVAAAFFLIVYSESIPDIFKGHVERLTRTARIAIVVFLLSVIAITGILISNQGNFKESDASNDVNKIVNRNVVDSAPRPTFDTSYRPHHDAPIETKDSVIIDTGGVAMKQRVIVDSSITRLKISSLTPSGISVLVGDSLMITASGKILIGPNFRYSSPYGIERLFSSSWVIQDGIRLGALMIKIGEAQESGNWVYCGLDYSHISETDGRIVFEVNDSYQPDNQGSYKVTIKRYRFGLR